MLIFLYFQCVNTVTFYGGEIQSFTEEYDFTLFGQSMASLLSCVSSIIGSLFIGRILDTHSCFKKLQIIIAASLAFCIGLTCLLLHVNAPNVLVLIVVVITGFPTGSVSVISY